jgi:PAS domain S-box-containing protein
MTNFFTPLMTEFTLNIPGDPISIAGWVIWLALLVFLTARHREKNLKLDRRTLVWLAALSIGVVLLTPFLGFPVGGDQSSGHPIHLMVFATVPWMLAGGVLGLTPSVLLAGFAGLLLAYLDTHSIFTPLLLMTASLVFTLGTRQPYRTWVYRLLRFPLISAAAAGLVLVPATLCALTLDNTGSWINRAVEALNGFRAMYLTQAGMVMLGGLVCTVVRLFAGKAWGGKAETKAAPGELSFRVRYTETLLTVTSLVLVFGLILQWHSAEAAARRSVVQKMTDTSDLVTAGLSEFIASGKDTVRVLAEDDRLLNADPAVLNRTLESLGSAMPYFTELAFITPEGQVTAAYPAENLSTFFILDADQPFLQEALSESSAAPVVLASSVKISFLAGVRNGEGRVTGVLWGRSSLESHRFMRPYAAAMTELAAEGGSGQVVGKDGLILFHTDPGQIWGQYGGSTFMTPTFFENEDLKKGRVLEYYQPVGNIGLAVVTEMPFSAIQQSAMEKVLPFFLSGLGMILVSLGIGQLFLGRIQRDIHVIETAAEKVTRGELNIALPRKRYTGEMDRLSGVFQKMLGTVRSRMNKQSELLSVSERITGQLKLHDSLQVVLLAALEHGVSSARIALIGDTQRKGRMLPEQQFGLGKHAQALAALDEDVLMLAHSRGQFVMRDSQIVHQFHLGKGTPMQGLMVAIPLNWKSQPLGVFWVTFDDRTTLSEDGFGYFNDLAHKAATAIINTKAFDESLTSRKRLESILTNLSDPVILADEKGEVIYLNDAARRLPGIEQQKGIGLPMSSLFTDEDLQTWTVEQADEIKSKEIRGLDGKAYLASILPLRVDGRKVGTAGVFRDVTQFKQKDDLKTEFVTMVSHELRSPLTLVQGYAKILQLSGNLNEQQDAYLGNIIDSVEEMKALVQDLLALGRLDGGDSLVLKEVSVAEVINKMMASMEPHARQKHIDVRLDLPEDSVFIEADPILLVQAINNLVDNAIQVTKNRQSIFISARKQADSVIFTVQDDGPGIAPLDQRRIFTPFFHPEGQVDPESISGSGLGLAIVKSIAERHDGKVWFESKLGQGSTFYLQVPLVQSRS